MALIGQVSAAGSGAGVAEASAMGYVVPMQRLRVFWSNKEAHRAPAPTSPRSVAARSAKSAEVWVVCIGVYDTAYRIQRYTPIQCIGCITTPQSLTCL